MSIRLTLFPIAMPIDKDGEGDCNSTEMELCSIPECTSNTEKLPGDEVEKECPICKCMVRYFFVNFNEKVLLCENRDCEYPFGYEDLVFMKHDERFGVDEELDTITSVMSRTAPTSSVISTRDWNDIEKLNKTYDSEDSQAELCLPLRTSSHEEKKVEAYMQETEVEMETKKNLEQIRKLNVKLQSTYEDDITCIRNEKWIKHLMKLQGMSGVQLLKKKEVMRFKARNEANLGSNELTIGIDKGSSISSITIALSNNGNNNGNT